MPELPEVETVVRDLRPLVVGRAIRAVRHGPKKLRKPWKADWSPLVVGTQIEGIRRRGKWMVLDLAGDAGSRSEPPTGGESHPRLIVHLGMTGQFTVAAATRPATNHLHLVFDLDDGHELRYRDARRFGSVTFHPHEAAVGQFFEANGLGPEPFGLDPVYFRKAVRNTTRVLKAILLDQQIVAGVGNIYADEACFLAHLHPGRRGRSLTHADADRLREAIETVLTKAIDRRGSTIRDYVGGSGLQGGFQTEFGVYGRTGDPCPVCATPVECVRLAGRSSHYCPTCQRVPAGRGKSGMKSRPRGS